MSVLAIAGTALRRIARNRVAALFIVVLPILVILLVGATVRNFDRFDVGIVAADDGPLARGLVEDIERSDVADLHRFDSFGAARTALRRAEVSTVVVVPAGLDDDLRAGRPVTITLLGEDSNTNQRGARSAVTGAVAQHAARVQAAAFAAGVTGVPFEDALADATDLQERLSPITLRTEQVDATSDFLPTGFSYSAPTMLVLFVFLNAVAAGAALIETRQLGIHERMLAAPLSPGRIVAGEVASYVGIAVVQSTLIVLVGAAVFGVDWGDPLAAGALVVVWALVGGGAGMLAGTVFRTSEQASSIGPAVGIAFGMLGGCMWPLEIVPPLMQRLGHVVPHAWAVDGWVEVLSHGATIAGILPELLVLTGFAAASLLLAASRLRASLTG